MTFKSEIRREIAARAAVLVAAVLALLLISLSGCAAEPVPTAQVAGDWSYSWELSDRTLHGTMTLQQEGAQVTGAIGWPIDYPPEQTTPQVIAGWTWRLRGQADGDYLPLYAVTDETVFDDPWWFNVTVDGDAMSGPEMAGQGMYPRYTFTAVRQ